MRNEPFKILENELNDFDELDPELRAWVQRDQVLGSCLKHPLVYQVPFYSSRHANLMLQKKQRRLTQYLDREQYLNALWMYERPYRLSMLYDWWKSGEIDDQHLRSILPYVWHMYGWIRRTRKNLVTSR